MVQLYIHTYIHVIMYRRKETMKRFLPHTTYFAVWYHTIWRHTICYLCSIAYQSPYYSKETLKERQMYVCTEWIPYHTHSSITLKGGGGLYSKKHSIEAPVTLARGTVSVCILFDSSSFGTHDPIWKITPNRKYISTYFY